MADTQIAPPPETELHRSVIDIALERADEKAKARADKAAVLDTKPDSSKPPPPEKPVTTSVPAGDDDMPEVIAKSTKASADWKAKDKKHREVLESLNAKHATEMAGLKKQQQEAAVKADQLAANIPKEEYETLKKQHEELSTLFKITAVEKHPDFVAKYDTPIKSKLEAAKRLAGDKGEMLAKLLMLPDSQYRTEQLDGIVEELSPSKKLTLGGVIGGIDELMAAREQALKEPEAMVQQIQMGQRSQEERQKAQYAQFFDKALDSAIRVEKVAALQEREGDAEWNQAVKERKEQARKIYMGELAPNERAESALRSTLAVPLMQQNIAALKTIEEHEESIATLTAENEKLKAARPKLDGTDGKAAVEDGVVAGESLEDRIARRTGERAASRR